jgi:uncharacterized protein (TIGR00730 family)
MPVPAIRSVTAYAASAPEAPPPLRALARAIGDGIAERGWLLVYGGARIGLMGELADAALARGGRVEGVILDTFARVAHQRLHVLDTVGDMRSRKAALAHRGDAFVTLPGGFGTLEELSEILVERQLGLHAKPLVLVNFEGFWDPLLALVEHQIAQRLVKPAYRELLTVVPDAAGALAALDAAAGRSPAAVTPDLGKLGPRG